MKNPYIIPAAMICAAILAGFWMLKSPSEPQEVIVVKPPQRPVVSIHKAAERGNIEAVKQHIAAGTDVNWNDLDAGTPLHQAAAYGHTEIVKLLLAKGANVNTKTRSGWTPLDVADGKTDALLRKHGGKTGEELKAEGK